jgi:hypothetical protein
MLGKSLSKNLSAYYSTLSGLSGIPIYLHDSNQPRELPCIIVGYGSEEMSFGGGYGHYTVKGYTQAMWQGYEDSTNAQVDAVTNILTTALQNVSGLNAAVNVPSSGIDTRPAKGFCLNGLFIREATREEEGVSTVVNIAYDAFTAAKDSPNSLS